MNTTPRSCWSGAARPFHPFGRGLFMLLSALLLALPVPALAAPGDLDPSFDGDGSVLTDFGGFDVADALVVQSDGKLVAAGTTSIGNNGIALTRYNPDGSLDASFGAAGKVVTDLGGNGLPHVNALVVQPDGKLVVGGEAGGFMNLILARYHPDGSLDTSFGAGGLVVMSAGGGAAALVLQPDGKLVVRSSLSLWRFHGDGTLDTSFGGDGSVRGEVSSPALVLQSDGKLVAAGNVTVCSGGPCPPPDFALERFNPDGSPDTSFGSGGLVVTDFGATSTARRVVLQADGKLVAAGGRRTFDRVLARYHPDGTLDASFGTGGVVVTDGDSPFSVGWQGLAVQADGRLVAGTAGSDRRGGTLLARYNGDGSPDTSFGSGGAVQLFGFQPFTTIPLAFQSDGKLVVGGSSFFNGNADFVLARVLMADERPNDPPNLLLPKCGGRQATILGTSGNDTLNGTSGPDVILGLGGNDTIRGLEGNDTICGGPGRDRLIGNEGNDRLFGQGGNDKLFGDQGKDRLNGGSGRDACRTGERARRCEGKPASSKPSSGERPNDPPIPPRPPCPPISNFPCS